MAMSTRSENHENDDFSDFSKVKSKKYLCKVKQNNSSELSGYAFIIIYSKNGLADPPQTPASEFFYRAPLEPV